MAGGQGACAERRRERCAAPGTAVPALPSPCRPRAWGGGGRVSPPSQRPLQERRGGGRRPAPPLPGWVLGALCPSRWAVVEPPSPALSTDAAKASIHLLRAAVNHPPAMPLALLPSRPGCPRLPGPGMRLGTSPGHEDTGEQSLRLSRSDGDTEGQCSGLRQVWGQGYDVQGCVRSVGDAKGQQLWRRQGDRDMGTRYLGPSRGDGDTKGKCSGLRRGDKDTVLRTRLR